MPRFLPIVVLSLLLLSSASQARDESSPPGVDAPPAAGASPSSATEKAGSSHSNKGTITQTCTDSCNRSYEVCMDQESAIPGNGDTLRNSNNVASSLIGTSSDCSDHLRSCLNTCGG